MIIKRRLAAFCAIFLSLSLVSSFFYGKIKIYAAAALLIFAALAFAITLAAGRKCGDREKIRRYALEIPLLLSAAAFAFLFSYLNFDIRYKKTADRYSSDESVTCVLAVTKVNYKSSGYTRHEVTVKSIDGEEVGLRAVYLTEYQSFLGVGDVLSSEVTIAPSRTDCTLSGSYYLSKGFYLTLTSQTDDGCELIATEDYRDIHGKISLIGEKIYVRLLSVVKKSSADLLRALICADKSTLDGNLSENFKILGLSHMLAVSGMHLGIIAGFLAFVFGVLKVGRRFRTSAILIFSLVYVVICSFTPSVCRSFGMLALFYLEPYSRRPRDPPTSLLFAVFSITIISPYSVIDIGLIASFAATLGILTVGAPIISSLRNKNRIVRLICDPLVLTYSASLFVMPVSVICFGGFSLISPLSNIIFLPLLTLIMYLVPILLAASFSHIAVILPAAAADFLCTAVIKLSSFFALDDFLISMDYTVLKLLVIPFVLLLILFCTRKNAGAKFLPIVLSAYLLTAVGFNIFTYAEVGEPIFYTDGTNDAIVLFEGKKAMIIDNSNGGAGFLSDCAEMIEEKGGSLDALVLSHYHSHQTAGVSELINKYNLKQVVVLSGGGDSFNTVVSYCREKNTAVFDFGDGGKISYGGYTVTIATDFIERSSHKTTAVTVDSPKGRILYLGASSWESESIYGMLSDDSLPYRLIIGCHGPKIKSDVLLPAAYDGIAVEKADSDINVKISDKSR